MAKHYRYGELAYLQFWPCNLILKVNVFRLARGKQRENINVFHYQLGVFHKNWSPDILLKETLI